MLQIAAVLHTHNDALRLGRCLETVYPCDEILIIDHGSTDGSLEVAREYGARIVGMKAGDSVPSYSGVTGAGWILCLDARESLTEALAASLYEWKLQAARPRASSFSILLREETSAGWIGHAAAQTRLVPVNWNRWNERFPADDPAAVVLQGEILRFAMP